MFIGRFLLSTTSDRITHLFMLKISILDDLLFHMINNFLSRKWWNLNRYCWLVFSRHVTLTASRSFILRENCTSNQIKTFTQAYAFIIILVNNTIFYYDGIYIISNSIITPRWFTENSFNVNSVVKKTCLELWLVVDYRNVRQYLIIVCISNTRSIGVHGSFLRSADKIN